MILIALLPTPERGMGYDYEICAEQLEQFSETQYIRGITHPGFLYEAPKARNRVHTYLGRDQAVTAQGHRKRTPLHRFDDGNADPELCTAKWVETK